MHKISSSSVALHVIGDELVPEEISRLLCAQPTDVRRKGEEIKQPWNRSGRVANTGLWRLIASNRMPTDFNGQIAEILGKTTPEIGTWKAIAERFHVKLLCSLVMKESFEAITISPDCLSSLGIRGLQVQMVLLKTEDEELEGKIDG